METNMLSSGYPEYLRVSHKGKNGATNATKPKDTKTTKARNMEHAPL
jgi:hypothetical protein